MIPTLEITRIHVRRMLIVAGAVVIGGAALALTSVGAATERDAVSDPPEPWVSPRRAARKKNPVPADEQSLRLGRRIYVRECLSCHGDNGRGDGVKAAELDPRPRDLRSPEIWEQTDGSLFWKMTTGRAPRASFKTILTDEERWHVINYLHTFAPGESSIEKPVPPKFDAPVEVRKAISAFLKSYRALHEARVKQDAVKAEDAAASLTATLNDLRKIRTDTLGQAAAKQWHDNLVALAPAVDRVADCETRDAPATFAALSKALAELIGDFGHAEKEPWRQFASSFKIDNAQATWIQHERKPSDPYLHAKHTQPGTLKRVFASQRIHLEKGESP